MQDFVEPQSDRIAVQAFLDKRINFSDIPVLNEKCMEQLGHEPQESLDHVLEIDHKTRRLAEQILANGLAK